MKPHISDLRIDTFRGLKSIELKSLGQFSLLVGFNNSGKSSILEAIEYFCKPMDPLALINLSRRRDVSVRRHDPVQTIRWLFPKDSAQPDGDFFESAISVSGTVEGVRKTIETTFHGRLADVYVGRAMNIDGSDPDEVAPPTTTAPPESNYQKKTVDLKFLYYEGDDPNAIHNFNTSGYTIVEGLSFSMHKRVEAPAIPCVAISPVTHRIDSSQTKGISNAIRSNLKNEIVDIIQRFDPEIKDIVILDIGGYPEVWIEHVVRGFMPLSSFGDGLRRVLVIAGGLLSSKDGILLIDEIEAAIHKDALYDVFRWLRESADAANVQVVLTTHSLEAIDALLLAEKDQTDEVIAFRLPTPKSNERLVRYSGETLRDLRVVGGMEVR